MSNNDNSNNDQNQQKPNDQGQGPQPTPPVRMNRGIFSWLILVGVVVMILMFISSQQNQPKEVKWGEMRNYLGNEMVEEVIVKDDTIVAKLKDDHTPEVKTGKIAVAIDPSTKEVYVKELNEKYADITKQEPGNNLWIYLLTGLLPWILIIAFFIIMFRLFRGASGGGGMLGNFGRSKHKLISREMTNIRLEHVAGIQEAKEEVEEIIEFLKNPKKFQRLGGRIPRGVLLVGRPGCGKTLLAKAVAGEAEVPFYSISGSDFVEMFVGVGASRVRDLFKTAKENSPCIIFLDEIDAVGRRRGSGFSSGGHDEREQTLNAILVEMDGFETNDQVIVIAATNRADVLDPALTRPGRFDRQIVVPLPDIKGRMEILKVHAKRVKTSDDIDLEKLARGTPMFSGAELEAIINEAAIIATMSGKDFVEQNDLEEARDKVKFGRAYKSRKIDEDERVGTAYHEAGHALIQKLLADSDPLHKVTIIPRGQALGATFSLPEKDRLGFGRKYLLATMRVLCGGRIAEEKKTNDITSGAAMDIKMATQYAREMILEWGMSDKLGFVNYAPQDDQQAQISVDKHYSDDTAQIIDSETKALIEAAYKDAENMINDNWDKVVAIAEALLRYETLSADEVDKLIKGETLSKPTVSDLLSSEAARLSDSKKDEPKAESKTDDGHEDSGGAIPSPA